VPTRPAASWLFACAFGIAPLFAAEPGERDPALDVPGLSDAELDAELTPLRSADPQARAAAVEKVAAAPPEAMEALARRLQRAHTFPIESYRALVLEIWGQVPNWLAPDPMWVRKPEPVWVPPPRVPGPRVPGRVQPRVRRPPPHDPEKVDWAQALNELDLQKPELAAIADRDAVRADALEIVALLRGISASRRLDAVDPLFRMAFELDGVFRDECGRQIRAMESYAIPALIRLMHQKGTAAQRLSKQRRYASYQLDRMDRARPAKAIATAPDDRVRAEIIHAYGEVEAIDAVEAILNQVDAPSHRVRKEARWAWSRYVRGKAPPPAPKRKRKLPGGKEEKDEKPDYLTYREIALLALQKQVAAINNTPVDPKATADQLTDELFAYYDKGHAGEWEELFRSAEAKESAGDHQGAAGDYGWILAHDPNFDRRALMAPAFAAYAEKLQAAGEISRALGFYRVSIDLDPSRKDADRLRARVAYLDGMQGLKLGDADPLEFQKALALDPSLGAAKEALELAKAIHARRRLVKSAQAAGVAFGLLFLLWLLWRRASAERSQS
jgi:hypothetical protein